MQGHWMSDFSKKKKKQTVLGESPQQQSPKRRVRRNQ